MVRVPCIPRERNITITPMQSVAFAVSPSNAPIPPARPTPSAAHRFRPVAASLKPQPINNRSSRLKWRPGRWISGLAPPEPSDRRRTTAGGFAFRKARSLPESGGGGGESAIEAHDGMQQTLRLGALIGVWYLLNVYFNIYNKQVLKVYPYPMALTTFQFAVGTVLIIFMWSTNLYRRPKLSSSQLLVILPLAVLHTLGNIFTNMSLGKVAVSFTHTIKAMEPFFTVVLSAMFLGEFPTLWIVFSLVPIVGGVALASLTEASFNWLGFWSAMASNLTNQFRNVVSKKYMANKEESLDNITLFSIITIMSFFLSLPVSLFTEGIAFTPLFVQSAGWNLREIYVRALLAGLCFHAYQQVSYMILSLVSPVTHSVANCVKRVVVITSSVLFFKTPVTPINALGTGVALAGVFLYSRAKKIKPKSE